MKYRSGKSLPGSVAVWLEQQLEDRGIDAAVYSHYIISLLQDDSLDLVDLPPKKKGNKRGRKRDWYSSPEVLKRSAVLECLTAACDETAGIEALVDELCLKVKAINSEASINCLKESSISNNYLEKSQSPASVSKYYAAFPALTKDNSPGQPSAWTKNICLSLRKECEGSPKEGKVVRRRDCGKENRLVRMRSRSMVKQSGGMVPRSRNTAKSLDRKDERATPTRLSKGKGLDLKNRKCFAFFDDQPTKKVSRTPGHLDKLDDSEYKFLPMDFQQLLQSPEDGFHKPPSKQPMDIGNFIQCGTNITSSIWTEKSERMEDESFPEDPLPWENKSGTDSRTIPWNNAPESLLSSSWKVPVDFGNLLNNNYLNNNKLNWSDVESTSLALKNDGCFFSNLGSQKSDVGLKHNNSSSFIEVTPKQKTTQKSPKKKPALYTYKHMISDQEEDLLTSTKTHFKPIKLDMNELSDSNLGPGTVQYADGTCFSVSSSLEKVNFHRSDSGALYIGPDLKYMEFKSQRSTGSSASISPEFVPKFKVNLNEKFCQTDDSNSVEDVKCNEFFFPEDEQLAEDMVNSLVEDEEPKDMPPAIKVEGFLTSWPIGTSDIWSNTATYGKQSWLIGGGWKGETSEGGDHYIRLRNELSEDGEQLLSDLSSIHLFIDSDHIPDSLSSSKAHYPKRMRFRPCSFQNRNMANESLA